MIPVRRVGGNTTSDRTRNILQVVDGTGLGRGSSLVVFYRGLVPGHRGFILVGISFWRRGQRSDRVRARVAEVGRGERRL